MSSFTQRVDRSALVNRGISRLPIMTNLRSVINMGVSENKTIRKIDVTDANLADGIVDVGSNTVEDIVLLDLTGMAAVNGANKTLKIYLPPSKGAVSGESYTYLNRRALDEYTSERYNYDEVLGHRLTFLVKLPTITADNMILDFYAGGDADQIVAVSLGNSASTQEGSIELVCVSKDDTSGWKKVGQYFA